MRDESMNRALKLRRGQGLDISVFIGGNEDEQEDKVETKELGLAPKGSNPTNNDGIMGKDSEQALESAGANPVMMGEQGDMPSMQEILGKLPMGRNSIAGRTKAMATKGK